MYSLRLWMGELLMMKVFEETLYGQTKSGGVYEWKITVEPRYEDAVNIIVTRGLLNGKKTKSSKVIKKGKNIGKVNETTPIEQAIFEAKSKRNEKLDDGYDYTIEGSKEKFKNLLKPMLAQSYDKHKKKLAYPCYAQPKLDGVRCLARRQGDVVTLYSRKGKVLDLVPHINKALLEVLEDGQCADGELYTHGWDFQKIISAIKKTNKNTPGIEYHIYDLPDMNDRSKPFVERFNSDARSKIFKASHCLVTVHTPIIRTEEFLMSYEDACCKEGYEGIMARNADSLYLFGYRSVDLLKVKRFLDAEYKVVGFTDGTAVEKGCLIFICETEEGRNFRVRPTGSHEERKSMFANGESYIGKMLTVKFQELSNDKVPRFPVGLHIREDWDMSEGV